MAVRLTWNFSGRATLGGHRFRTRRPGPVTETGRWLSAALVRTAVRAARPRRLRPAAARAPRRLHRR
ncbi:hypothetical protein [Streptomyces graminofaciens]|uniref:hypothetical protein n=1 Tax=Streptomyces graminofaciens TaxID=68212 RepID=UPI002573C2C4|nr:hypothetical protein [Streptomyces graminofaciens]